MRPSTRFVLAAFSLAGAVLLAGCSDEKKPAPQPSCQIVSPADGAFIAQEQDSSGQAQGIQIDVVVGTANATGGQVSLRVGTEDVAPATVGADGSVTFSGVTLPPGPLATTLACRVTSGSQTVQGPDARILVGPSCGLRFVSPAGGAPISRAETHPGVDGRPAITVVVEADGVEAGSLVTLEVGDAGQAQTYTAALSPDRATFEVPVFQAQSTRFFASAAGQRCQPRVELRAPVDLGACATRIVPGNGTVFGIVADRSPAPGGRPGLQTEVCVETECADGSNARLQVDNGVEQLAPIAGGRACFEVSLAEGARVLRGRVESATGTGMATPATHCVDLTAPSASLGSPTAGATLRQAQDRDPATPGIVEFLVEGTTSGTTTSCTVARPVERVELVVNGSVQSRFAPSSNGNFSRVARFPQGPNKLQVCAVDQAGNRGCGAEIDLTVDLNQPTLRIESPAPGARLLKATDPVAATPLRELDVTVSAAGIAAGATVTVDVDDGHRTCQGTLASSGGGLRAQLRFGSGTCAALPDGEHKLSARATDASGAAAVSQEVVVVIDNTPPTLSFTEPAAGALVYGSRVDVALLTTAEDGQVVTLRGGAGGMLTAPVVGGGVLFSRVGVTAGSATLRADVSDAAGNPAASASVAIRVAAEPARDLAPSFSALSEGQVLRTSDDVDGDLDNGVQVDVSLTLRPGTRRVTLQVAGGSIISQELAAGASSARFDRVTLGEGANQLVATAFDEGAGHGVAAVRVTVSTERLEVALVTPADGALLPASADVDPATAGIQLPVVVTTSSRAPITDCTVITNPGASEQRWTLTTSGTRCQGVVTVNSGENTLVAVAQSDRVGRSRPARVTLDGTAPVVAFVSPVPPSDPARPVVLSATAPDTSGRPGFQTEVVLQADAIEPGADAWLTVQGPGEGPAVRYLARFDANRRARFPSVTLTEDAQSILVARAIDLAGNEGAPRALAVWVDRNAPVVQITNPAPGAVFGLDDDRDPGPDFGVDVAVRVSGAEVGQPVHLRASAPEDGAPLAEETRTLIGGETEVEFNAFSFPLETSGAVVLTASTVDRAGNQATSTLTVQVDVETGTLLWVAPAATPSPTRVCNEQDLDPNLAGVQYGLTLSAQGLPSGALVEVRDASDLVVGRGAVSAGNVAVTATLPAGERVHVLQASARRPSGNTTSTSETRSILVDTLAPVVTTFTCDGDRNGNGFLTRSENRDGVIGRFEMGCTVNFSDASMSGRTVRILSNAPAAGTEVGSATVNGQTANITVSLAAGTTAAPEVLHALTLTGTDDCAYPLQAGSGVSLTKSFTVDLELTSVTWFSPGPTPSPVQACPAQDLDPATAGIQYNVTVRTTGFAPGAVVTLRDAADAVVGSGSLAADSSATVTLTLPAGDTTYVLRASSTRRSGETTSTTDTRSFRVDTVAPVVSSFVCDGDRDGNGFLSRSENRAGLTDRFEMGCTVGFADASMNGRTVRILSATPTAGTEVGTATVIGQTATITVSLASGAAPVAHALTLSGADACANASVAGTGVSLSKSYTVDITPPTVTVTAPVAGLLVAANDKVPAPPRQNGLVLECCTGAAGAFDITANVQGAVGVNANLKVNGAQKATALVGADGSVRFANVGLDQGSQSLTVEVTDEAGNLGASPAVALTVDSVPPTVSITSPAANQQLATNLIDVAVAYGDVEAGRTVEVRRRNAGSNGQGAFTVAGTGVTSAAGTATISIVLPQGSHELQAATTDVNGNAGLSTPVSVEVTASNPTVTFESPASNPALFNAASGVVGASGIAIDIVAQTTAPAGVSTAVLLKGGTQVAGPVPVTASGGLNRATFSAVGFGLTETGSLLVRVTTTGLGDFNSVAVPYTVDVAEPTLAFSPPCKAAYTAADADGLGRLTFNFTTDAEANQVVTLTSDLVSGQSFTGAVVSGSAAVGPLALPQGVQILTARVADRAGNERVETCVTDVDLQAPNIPVFTVTRVTNRRGAARLTWTVPGDDGTTGSAASYALVQRECAVGAVCTIANDAEFTAATAVPGAPILGTGGATENLVVTVPLQRLVTFAIRATDGAGNASAIASATVNTDFTTDTVAGPAGETEFGASVRVVDVDRDGVPDIIIGRPGLNSNAGAIRVVYGDPSKLPTDIAAADVGLAASARFGRAVDAAGDVDGDGFEDVIVGAPGTASSACTSGTGAQTGRAVVLFGGAAGLRIPASTTPCEAGGNTNCHLLLAAPASDAANQVCSYGQGVTGVGRVGGGAGRPLFAITAGDLTSTSTRVGKAFLYQTSGDRPALTTTLMTTLIGGAQDFHFGAAVCGVGDVNGDLVEDFVVGAHRRGQTPVLAGRAYLFLGGSRFATAGGTVTIVNEGSAPNDGIVKFGDQIASDSFGQACRGAGDLDGDSVKDFIINASGGPQKGVYVVKGRADLDALPPTLPSLASGFVNVTHPDFVTPGEIDAGQDIDGDGRPDLIIGNTTGAYVFAGDSVGLVRSTPIAVFTSTNSVSTGYPVFMTPNWKTAATGEGTLPDIGFGRFTGPSIGIRY